MIENIDSLCRHCICQTMRDHDYRFCSGEFADGAHDVLFGLRIYIACGLVEDVDRRVVENRAGEGQALALPAGEVGRVFGETRLEPIVLMQELGQACELQGAPQLGVGGTRLCHAQVVRDGSRKEVSPQAHHGHVAEERFPVDFAHLVFAEQHLARVAVQTAREECGYG